MSQEEDRHPKRIAGQEAKAGLDEHGELLISRHGLSIARGRPTIGCQSWLWFFGNGSILDKGEAAGIPHSTRPRGQEGEFLPDSTPGSARGRRTSAKTPRWGTCGRSSTCSTVGRGAYRN